MQDLDRRCRRCGYREARPFCPRCGDPQGQVNGHSAHLEGIRREERRTGRPHGLRGIRICSGCGLVALEPRRACEGCGSSATVDIPPPRDLVVWARVTIEVRCEGCGQRSPLASLDASAAIRCSSCGALRVLTNREKSFASDIAQDVADLSGPHPEGRESIWGFPIAAANPYRRIGLDRALATLDLGVEGQPPKHNIFLHIGPGHPLCRRCREPLWTTLRRVSTYGVEPDILCLACQHTPQIDESDVRWIWGRTRAMLPGEAPGQYWLWLDRPSPKRLELLAALALRRYHRRWWAYRAGRWVALASALALVAAIALRFLHVIQPPHAWALIAAATLGLVAGGVMSLRSPLRR